ncbi:MAG: hypothetical protein OHK0052_21270 [Anaerolineales bacterium]
MTIDAIVTAGGVPKIGEPLYPLTQGKSKALLEINGKPMIQWVLDSLSKSPSIGNVVVMGLDESSGVTCEKPLFFMPSQGSMVDNILGGAKRLQTINPAIRYMLIVSSDIPTLTSEMVEWLVQTITASDHDVYYGVITRDTMEARFPGSKRSYTHLKDMVICGADINAVQMSAITSNYELWSALIEARKNAFKQASLIGWGTLLLLLLRQLTLDGVVQRVGSRLGLRGRALVCPYAEMGMDVDKPAQFEMLNAALRAKA